MSNIKYLDKYDKEFVNLMIEIENRVQDFSKSDKLKINSWIKSLCLPTNNIPWKKNRNLYAIKLLDNILNFRLEEPFTKFAESSENLPMLNHILVKSQLSNKIKEIIFNSHPDEQIQNFVNSNYEINEPEEPKFGLELLNKNRPIYRTKTPSGRINRKNYFYDNMNNNGGYINNKTIGNNIRDNEDIKTKKNKNKNKIILNNNNIENEEININKMNNFYKGDQLLNKNYFMFDKKISNEPGFYKKTNPYSIDIQKKKLQSSINDLENELNIKNQIINQNDLDIQELKNRISQLENRIKIAFKQ